MVTSDWKGSRLQRSLDFVPTSPNALFAGLLEISERLGTDKHGFSLSGATA